MKKNIKPILFGIAIVAVILLVWNFVIKKIQESNEDDARSANKMVEEVYRTFTGDADGGADADTTGFGSTESVAQVDVAVFKDPKPTVFAFGVDRRGAARALMAGMSPEVVVNDAASAVVVSQNRAKLEKVMEEVKAAAAKKRT